ncbi:MAG: hypothetical protein KF905_16955 [Flavobacteriales bacterium]|nr:hypothetical protein [Flavobacteriales bacterium]
MQTKGARKRRSRINAVVSASLKKRLKLASTAQSRSMTEVITDALERNLPDLPTRSVAKGRTWVDELAGSASFSDAELEGDERLARLVHGARTKASDRQRK